MRGNTEDRWPAREFSRGASIIVASASSPGQEPCRQYLSATPRAPRRQQFCCQQSPRAVSWSRKSLPVPPADSAAFRQQQLRCQHLAASSPVASSFGSSISLEHWVATVDGRFKLRATHKAAGRAAAGIGDIPPTCPSFGGVWRSEPYAPGLSRVSACVHGRCMRFLLACEPSYVDATADLSACVRLSRSRLGFALAFASALGFALASPRIASPPMFHRRLAHVSRMPLAVSHCLENHQSDYPRVLE